jgi:hypothetical protein
MRAYVYIVDVYMRKFAFTILSVNVLVTMVSQGCIVKDPKSMIKAATELAAAGSLCTRANRALRIKCMRMLVLCCVCTCRHVYACVKLVYECIHCAIKLSISFLLNDQYNAVYYF